MLTNLDLKKAANDLAYGTITQNFVATDAATAAKAVELALTDAQYQQFKQSVANFRQQYQQAASQDAQIAAAAANAAKQAAARQAATPPPAPVPSPTPEVAPQA